MAFRRDPFFDDPFFDDFDRDMQDFRKKFFSTSFFGDEPNSSGSLFSRDRPRLGGMDAPMGSGASIGTGLTGFRSAVGRPAASSYRPRESWYEREVAPFKSHPPSKYAGSSVAPSEAMYGRKGSHYEGDRHGPTIETIPSTCSTPCPSEYSSPPLSRRSSTMKDPLFSPEPPTSPPPSYAASVASEPPTPTPTPTPGDQNFHSEIFIPAKSGIEKSGKNYSRSESVPLSKNVIIEEKDGIKKMKIQLDVGDYAVNEINITAEDQKLKVQCCKEVEDRDGNIETQEYKKQLKLPESVDPELITSFLSQDGILTVECMLPEPAVKALEGPITQDEDGNQVIKLEYNVTGFHPSEISVKIDGETLRMYAFHEEKDNGNITVTREFNKEFALPDGADKNSLKYCVENNQLNVLVHMPKKLFERQLSQEALEGSKLHLEFDVSSFDPEDIQVKIVGTTLKIQAMREEQENNATVCREFSRQCVLPEWVDQNALRSYLTADGKLTIEIPMEKPQEEKRLSVEVRHK